MSILVNYARLALKARQEFIERTQKYIIFFRERMQIINSHNKLWRCDPETHLEGKFLQNPSRQTCQTVIERFKSVTCFNYIQVGIEVMTFVYFKYFICIF